jgi:hypothetical protein
MKLLSAGLLLLLSFSMIYAQQQGITGKVEWLSGNQMPGPGKSPGKPKPIKREIWIYEPVFVKQTKAEGVFFSEIPSEPITKVKSGCRGRFRVRLPPGEYSLFIKENSGLFANRFDGQNRINCIVVKPGEFTKIVIRVDYEAAY